MAESRFIQTRSGRFHAMVAGNGKPLILVHGYDTRANSWRTWDRNIDALAQTNRVYALDLLGYGESDKPEPRPDSAAEGSALVQLLEAEQIPQASWVGLSWGGEIVQTIALEAPQRVDKLVLVDSAFDSGEEGLAQLVRVSAPTLIIWDEDDAVIPVAWADALAKAIPNSQLKILKRNQRDPNADPQNRHWSQKSHSKIFNRMVSAFLAEPAP